MKKFIIDADTGSDDAVAILLALQDPSIEILGISVVSGNVPLQQGIKNTISTMDMTGKKVKVFAGADKPLTREYEEIYVLEKFMEHVKSLKSSSASGQCVHGIDGMGDIGIESSTEEYEEKNAIDFIIDTVNENPNDVTLVTPVSYTHLTLPTKRIV